MKDFKIFIPLLWPHKDRFVQLCIFTVLLVLIAQRFFLVLIPQQIGQVTDELAAHHGEGGMPWKPLILWAAYYWLDSEAGLVLLKNLALLRVQWYSQKSISATSFRYIMIQSMDFHSNKNSGELIRAIEQGHNLQGLLDFVFFEIGPTFIDLGVSLVYVYVLFDVYVSLMLLAVGTLYVWVAAKITKMSIPSRRQLNAAQRNETKVQNEAISNWRTVSHFNQAKYECTRYNTTVDQTILAECRYYHLFYFGNGVENLVLLLGRLATHSYAVYLVVQGFVPLGRFVTLTVYWGSVARPLAELSWHIRRVSQMFTDSERLLQLFMTKPSVVDCENAKELRVTDGEVEFNHVDFTYDLRNPKPTLKDLSFHARPGQTIALVGETGGGKSTVLKLLYRYHDIQSGSIRIDGQDIRHVTQNSLRDSFGMVPQDPALFNGTILENVRYARLDATDAEVEEACRAGCIHDKILTFPDGYATTVGERGVKLSGGELQRIAIARAVLRRPKIVLLDEATSAIDAETETQIQTALKQLTSGRTTFVIAHRLSTIQHADLILVIQKGQVVERGTHDELIGKGGGYYVQLWAKQLSKAVEKAEGELVDLT